MRLRPINFLFTAVLLAATACGAQENTRPDSEHAGAEASPDGAAPTLYHAYGLVRSITPNRSHVVVAHGDVPGFMDAMTMPFAVADPDLLSDVSPLDSIRFVIEVDGPKTSVVSLDVIEYRARLE